MNAGRITLKVTAPWTSAIARGMNEHKMGPVPVTITRSLPGSGWMATSANHSYEIIFKDGDFTQKDLDGLRATGQPSISDLGAAVSDRDPPPPPPEIDVDFRLADACRLA